MVLTYSEDMNLGMKKGTLAPEFRAWDPRTEKEISDQELFGSEGDYSGTIVAFICNHCPYVKHLMPVWSERAAEWQKKGIQIIAISSNDVENYPDDRPEKMAELANQLGWDFPYLFDQSQDVARAYGAQCTPEFYLFGADRKCFYHGRFDGSSPGNDTAVTGGDLKRAVECLLSNQPIDFEIAPSMGCNIKWKKS